MGERQSGPCFAGPSLSICWGLRGSVWTERPFLLTDNSLARPFFPGGRLVPGPGKRSRMGCGLLRLLGPPPPATHLPARPNGPRNPAAPGLRAGDRAQRSGSGRTMMPIGSQKRRKAKQHQPTSNRCNHNDLLKPHNAESPVTAQQPRHLHQTLCANLLGENQVTGNSHRLGIGKQPGVNEL